LSHVVVICFCNIGGRSVTSGLPLPEANVLNYFYFGVLHPVARISSSYWKNRPFATIFQGVYFMLLLCFAATCFGPSWPSSGGILGSYFNYKGSMSMQY
jgi:hypothetical protein